MDKSFNTLISQFCNEKNNRLCIGLDYDIDRLPNSLVKDMASLHDYIIDVIEATISFTPAYKPNFAFFERYGSKGYSILERIPDIVSGRAITIADAKRADIGNSSLKYNESILCGMGYDSITISPYMGRDSIEPFTTERSKGVFVLCLTSNKGADDFQKKETNTGQLYFDVLELCKAINTNNNIGIVVGATQSSTMELVANKSDKLTWLMPGIGAQGGDLENSIRIGNMNGIGIVNVSRSIIYNKDSSIDSVCSAAKDYTDKIRRYL